MVYTIILLQMKALFIGRFQPFHNGHLKIIEEICKEYKDVILGVGSAQYSHTPENPFSFAERSFMIKSSLEHIGIKNFLIVKIPDIHNYPKWVDHVNSIVTDFDVLITNSKIIADLFLKKNLEVKKTPLYDRNELSGKEIRKKIIQDMPWKSLVPKSVYDFILEIDGVKRLKNLSNV